MPFHFSKKVFFFQLKLACISIFLKYNGFAQQRYANEWINYQQTYFKIPIGQKGLYRLTSNDLRTAGFPLSSVNPTAIQLFFRGQEQAIFVQGETDGRFDDADFIEFYGEGNNGTQDSLLYIPHSAQPHKFFNLYSDTTAYFLTWRLDGQAGKRMGFYQENPAPNTVAEGFHNEDLWISNIPLNTHIGMSEGLMYPLGISSGAQHSFYDFGEGWTGAELRKNRPFTKEILLENPVRTGPAPSLEIHLMGRDHRRHLVEIWASPNASTGRLLDTVRFEYQYHKLLRYPLRFTDVSASNRIFLTTNSLGADPDQSDDVYSVTYHRLRYPQRYDMTGKAQKHFFPTLNTSAKSYLEIVGASAETRLFDITDPNQIIRIGSNVENSTLKVVVRGTNVEKTLFATSKPLSVPSIQRVTFRNIDATKHNYLVITHPNLLSAARQFAGYRSSTVGGRYDTLTVTMDLLVNQFNYGEFSPLAVRRFVQFMADKGNPRFLFIIGQTQQVDFNRFNPNRANIDMVPTFGWPGSDNLFSHGLKGQPSLVPAIPTGRLWTNSPQTVLDYLAKVREHEATPPNTLWRKNILHLSGGISAFEQRQFKQIMEGYRLKAEREYLGARVRTITKKTDEPVEYIGIANELNEGVGIITLFGHSSLSVTDIDIGYVSDDVLGYRNKGRYPLVLANGCILGNFTFGFTNTYPTDWVNTKDRGAVLFLAHSNLAFVYSIKDYADTFYDILLNDSTHLSRPFGEVQQQIVKTFLAKYPNDPIYQADVQQYSLQGDPAVVLFPARNPDFVVDASSIMVKDKNGLPPTPLTDSLQVQIKVSNVGLYKKGKLSVRLLRTARDGNTQTFERLFEAVAYQDTLRFLIPNDRTQSGLNRFEVQIDPDNLWAEISKSNNAVSVEIPLPVLGAYPLFPYDYATISTTENGQPIVQLLAQNVENVSRNYVFEIDTTARFDSPFKRTQSVTASSLPSWKVNVLPNDSTTYYWRIRYADRPANADNPWAESSFTYIKNGNTGWVQRQAPQFDKSQLLDIQYSATSQPTWTYRSTSVPIRAVVAGSSVGAFNEGYRRSLLQISNILLVANGNCTTFDAIDNWRPGANIVVTALRQDDLRAYSVMPELNCGNPPYVMNTLRQREIINNGLLSRWLSAVPDGDWVVLMSVGGVRFDFWPASEIAQLRQLGVPEKTMEKLQSPYLIIVQKGSRKVALEVQADPEDLAPSIRAFTVENFQLKSTVSDGLITSSLIGPASQWGEVFRKIVSKNGQEAKLEIWGVNFQGQEMRLQVPTTATKIDLRNVDAKKHPYLRLRLYLNNSNLQEALPAQLREWWVSFTPVAEGTANSNLTQANLTRQEGEPLVLNVAFKNISSVAFRDSIVVMQTLYAPNGTTETLQRKLKPLAPNEESGFSLNIPTLGRSGNNRLLIDFNPRQQPEQTYANNQINVPFSVVPDRVPPLLDVVFDGRRIKDSDVVSASPTIVAELRDENRFLFKRDTVGIDLFLQLPNANIFRRIPFSSNRLRFIPADAQNVARIEYRPGTLPDGLYTLRVQGADASLNRTGIYQITFRIINEQKLIAVEANPNPFSQRLRFVLTISGQEPPTEGKIWVSDMNGKIVEEIHFVPRVGVNEIGWNVSPTLPTGSYFYRVQVGRNGQEILPQEAINKTGKLLLIR
ncbi:MAG: C25 family cysteine peptidase [Runella sp.]